MYLNIIKTKKGEENVKKIKLRIYADGKIEAQTSGIKGKACLDYISILESLTGATTVDSDFTEEYRQQETLLTQTVDNEVQA